MAVCKGKNCELMYPCNRLKSPGFQGQPVLTRPYYSIQTRWQLLHISSILSFISNILETLVLMQLHDCLERNCPFDMFQSGSLMLLTPLFTLSLCFSCSFSLSVRHTLYWPLNPTDDLRLTSCFAWLAIIRRVLQCELGPAPFLPGGFIFKKGLFLCPCCFVASSRALWGDLSCSRCCINKVILCQTGLSYSRTLMPWHKLLRSGVHVCLDDMITLL